MRAAAPYAPPKGYVPVSEKDRTGSKAARIFDNLQGKQVWHITAPAGVSLKELESIALDKAMKGDAVLSQKGSDYGFSTTEKSVDGPREVLVLQKNGYSAVPAKISQTLHLQELVRLPKLSAKQADPNTGSEAAASITRSTIRAPRPQAKGLKMRYLPLGFVGADSGGVLGESDAEDDAVPQAHAGLAAPNGLNVPGKAKRKLADAGEEAPAKKVRKQRSPEEVRKRDEKKAKKEKKAKA
ncbi:DNA-directed RNA polymerase I, subunit RPA34.5 [Boeremia exigua]|uniref:DNA-directed RNA polymerase I, subunit RPA34.5 n=1 Tax=Boeremia exigua TaxID=749465 RepID=UPI001E8EC220|nr:DNA-directed RNA polymerase I, subunit RPA34.5 [Boeremia exigua]KAH6637712.1 DNA-directed RNA polymerase I, subunit RPA34.5 [Boeremia exigua]